MRRRLVLLSLAGVALVVVSFVVPLALLVRRQAADNAIVRAERDAQSVAGLVALASALEDDVDSVAATVGDLPAGTVVVIGDQVVGDLADGQGTFVERAAQEGATVAGNVEGGWEIALPVVTGQGVAVVDSFVPNDDLTAGVAAAWALLGALALVLVAVPVVVADRLGRRLSSPIEDLAKSAHRLAEGDLDVRVTPSDPPEIRETGEAFNYLAGRLESLLAEEREAAADLSHRLRTPLTSIRLQAESLADDTERAEMITQIDRLEHAMNEVIELARSRGSQPPGHSEVNHVVAERAEFWRLLAEEQGRVMTVVLGSTVGVAQLSEGELGVLIDTVVGNVFAHTPAPTNFGVRTGKSESGAPWFEVWDRGPGLGDGARAARGVSGSGSTGLGLDIVRRAAESLGGELRTDDHPEGGAVIRVVLG
jgi:signal transduction histidine kinase